MRKEIDIEHKYGLDTKIIVAKTSMCSLKN